MRNLKHFTNHLCNWLSRWPLAYIYVHSATTILLKQFMSSLIGIETWMLVTKHAFENKITIMLDGDLKWLLYKIAHFSEDIKHT